MATLNEKLLHDVLSLSIKSRKELIKTIFESLDCGPDKNIDAIWEDELEKRIKEAEEQSVELIPEEQVFDEIWPWSKK
jgi:putative addiction module component (TIGR02574 family)